MKITFIVPSIGGLLHGGRGIKTWQMEPLEMAILSGLTPPTYERELFDDRMEAVNTETTTDLAAISVQTFNAKRAYEIARAFRKRGIPVVMGGYHATLMPQEVIKHCDSVLVGNAEQVWTRMLDDFQRGELKKMYTPKEPLLLKGMKPDWGIYKGKKYLPLRLMETGRGCRFNCDFCSITNFHGGSHTVRPLEEVVDEIKRCGSKRIFFVDDNIVSDRERAKQLFRAIAPLKIKWFSQGSIDMARDEELLDAMRDSGCLGILIGFESINKKNLIQMKKGVNLSVLTDQAVKRIHSRGIRIYATFIFGYDNDNEESLEETYQFILKQKFFITAINHLVPFPGTPLYDRMKREGSLLSDAWWLEDNYLMGDVVFRPKNVSPGKLKDICYAYRKKAYSMFSIFFRFFNKDTNFGGLMDPVYYFSINSMMRTDVRKRHGLPIARNNGNSPEATT